MTGKTFIVVLTVGFFSTILAENTCPRCRTTCIDGRDGRNGIDGKNGRDGSDGKDGINGLDGKSCLKGGKDGTNGTNGKDGKDGINGLNGKDGSNGKEGKVGPKGKDGSSRNWRECQWNKQSSLTNGVIKTCAFKKKSVTTSLKIVVATNMLIHKCAHCCKRWYVTFDGKECSVSVPIDIYIYQSGIGHSNLDLNILRVFRGHCSIARSGTIKVELRVGKCLTGDGADPPTVLTGWGSSSRIFIEEVDAPQS